jgi:hypothetical protein
VVATGAVAYLALTFAAPTVTPRLSMLPPPGAHEVWWDDCAGRPLNRHEAWWERRGPFWVRLHLQTLVGCIEHPVPTPPEG